MKHHTFKLKLIEIEPGNYHITLKGKVAERSVNLVVDTGASHTCFDIAFVRSLEQNSLIEESKGLKVGIASTDFECMVSELHHFSIGKLEIPNYHVVLLDLSHVNQAYKMQKKPLVQGILGGDFFVQYQAVIDYQKMEMTLWTSN